jgi:hypothetical protein
LEHLTLPGHREIDHRSDQPDGRQMFIAVDVSMDPSQSMTVLVLAQRIPVLGGTHGVVVVATLHRTKSSMIRLIEHRSHPHNATARAIAVRQGM